MIYYIYSILSLCLVIATPFSVLQAESCNHDLQIDHYCSTNSGVAA